MASIMEFSKDVSQQDAPEPLPAGDYPAEITDAQIKPSANTGRNYLALTFMISPNDYPADFTEGDADGTRLSYNRLTMEDTPRARYRLRQFCEAVGARVPTTSFDPSDLLGLRAQVNIIHDKYEGEVRAQIAKVMGA